VQEPDATHGSGTLKAVRIFKKTMDSAGYTRKRNIFRFNIMILGQTRHQQVTGTSARACRQGPLLDNIRKADI
jgi:hypothetical protein